MIIRKNNEANFGIAEATWRSRPEGLNLCRPDNRKSCAACCGLYNVHDGARPSLTAKLEKRSSLFRATPRTVAALEAYQAAVQQEETDTPLDAAIHVCEFTGFLDADRKIVGCLLHPSSPGNDGIDLRGLCYYGAMACKSFFCPSWGTVPDWQRRILLDVLDEWLLYGLVMTDVDFVRSVFRLLEINLGAPVDRKLLFNGPALNIFKEMLAWKDSWPFNESSKRRRSRYYFKRSASVTPWGEVECKRNILESLQFTFGLDNMTQEAGDFVQQRVEEFISSYRAIRAENIT
jgi:hypothetical protein